MQRNRLEAFSDGVIAILITIMVLELKVPHGAELKDIEPLIPIFLSYVLSFTYIAIYWNNHHHLIHTVKKISGSILWANLNLLFWLSLLPFVTAWMGENHLAAIPVIFYNVILLMAAISYYILQITIVKRDKDDSILLKALGKDYKGKGSVICYAISIPLGFVSPLISMGIAVLVAFVWLIPDKRIEKVLEEIND
jgi:uncharacterized membrane protein